MIFGTYLSMLLGIMLPGTVIQTLVVDEISEPWAYPEVQPPRTRLRCHAPRYIDLSLAQSQVSIERDFQGQIPKDTIWEPIYVADLSTSGKTELTHESYRKAQRAMAILWQTRVENNQSYLCEEGDIPEAPDYISHHDFSDSYTWMLWEREAQRNFAAVKEYLDEHPEKKEELWRMPHTAKRYWKKHTDDFRRYFPSTLELEMRPSPYSSSQICSIRTSGSSQISGEDAVLTDPAVVSTKFTQLAVETDRHPSESDFSAFANFTK
jgi:hypothetical protein